MMLGLSNGTLQLKIYVGPQLFDKLTNKASVVMTLLLMLGFGTSICAQTCP